MELGREEAIGESARCRVWHWTNIVSRPNEGIEIRDDDPGALLVQPKMLFRLERNLHAFRLRHRLEMRDRRHDDFRHPGTLFDGDDDCARPDLGPLMPSSFVLVTP